MKPIGIFDSGYGGLTVMKEIVKELPQYDYIYLGDNARAPYGTRSFETVHRYTWQCVQWFFEQGCELVILACNTASAKALRSIQQQKLVGPLADKRVLGVIRPTAELIGSMSQNKAVGVMATKGTVDSESYVIEIHKFSPDVKVFQEACPIWVPLVENNETEGAGVDYFVKKNLDHLLEQSPDIDTILLACTHYPLLMNSIRKNLERPATVVSQGGIVAESLKDYLTRHPEMEVRCSKGGTRKFYTTDASEDFNRKAESFFGMAVLAEHIDLA
jgi:glutamate racemase